MTEEHVRAMLVSLNLDLNEEHLADTPKRIAKFYRAFFARGQESFRFTTFEAPEHPDLVMTGNIRFFSLCSHHFAPFMGRAHIAYLPDKQLAGLSKLARTVRMFSHRPQVQERLTSQIADYLSEKLEPRGVAVLLQAEHLCMSMRGVEVPGHQTITEALRGDLKRRPDLLRQFRDYVTLLQKENNYG